MLKDDLTALGIKDGCWHQKALDRSRWMDIWSQYLSDQQEQQANQINSILCIACQRSFRCECDKAYHKCISERQLLIQGQAVYYVSKICFKSRGGWDWLFTSVSVIILHVLRRVSQWPHRKCNMQCVKKILEDQGALKGTIAYQKGRSQCTYNKEQCRVNGTCQHWFKSAGGLTVHRRSCNPC